MKALVWLTHSFRTQSKIFARGTSCNEVSFVYYSPFYYDDDYAMMYRNTRMEQEYWFRYSVSSFKLTLKQCDYDLYIYKEEDPVAHINNLIKKHGYEKVFIDKPLFNFPNTIDVTKINCKVEFVDSDIYDERCLSTEPYERVQYWLENHQEYLNKVSPIFGSTNAKLKEEDFLLLDDEGTLSLLEQDNVADYFINQMMDYSNTKKEPEGTFRISGHLQHGQVDAGTLILQILLASLYDRIAKKTWHIDPLISFAKREIAIIKARSSGLQPYDDVLAWAELLLDDHSYIHLTEAEYDRQFTRSDVLNSNTGKEDLDEVLKMGKDKNWLPHLLRKWMAIEVFLGMGGGVEALETILDYFHYNIMDGQSPSTMINCIEVLQLKDGKLETLDKEEVFKIMGM
tara:strand:- start:308 stop:1501 length:1194 start_codon:yes stop_codon:yes gene_type:complete